MTVTGYVVFILIAALQVGIPGPSTVYLVNNAMRLGVARAQLILAADTVGIGILATLSGFGLASVFKAMPALFTLIELAGSAYLILLGLGYCRPAKQGTHPADKTDRTVHERGLGRQLLASFLIGISNPKAILFFSALFPQFIGPRPDSWNIALMIVTFMIIKQCVLGAYALMAGMLEQRMTGNAFMSKYARPAVGCFFIVFGAVLAYSAVQ